MTKKTSKICLPRTQTRPEGRRSGLTLVEVIAAIAILGTVLVGVVLAKSRHTHQIALTQRKAVAIHAADELIAGWWADPEGVPVGESGVLDDAMYDSAGRDIDMIDPLRWQTYQVENETIDELGARVVRVELFDDEFSTPNSIDPLLQIDLVLPTPPPEGNEAEAPASEAEQPGSQPGAEERS